MTGGEPFLLEDIGDILLFCAAAAPTTVLTNGMLFTGRRAESLRALPRDRVVLQITLDSATPELHDLHRGSGTWARTREGIQRARALGFRVRLAATVSTDADDETFRQFLDEEKIAAEDRVIRRIALRGSASEGVAVSRADLVPEVTITADGVYWHPVGAEDADLLVTRDIFPLSESFAAVRRAVDREGAHRLYRAEVNVTRRQSVNRWKKISLNPLGGAGARFCGPPAACRHSCAVKSINNLRSGLCE